MRIHLFEFEDLNWLPTSIRTGALEYLSFLIQKLDFYSPCAVKIGELATQTGQYHILDLCSGSGKSSLQAFNKLSRRKFNLTLSDKFPQIKSWEAIQSQNTSVNYIQSSVDASKSVNRKGIRTMYSALHHFNEVQVCRLLTQHTKSKQPLLFFDGGNKSLLFFLLVPLVHLPLSFITAPFLRPFNYKRILLHYILPAIPFVAIWDGMVSVLRLYKPDPLLKLAKTAVPHYQWESGYIKSKWGLKIVYLLGYSK
jgi:hypothetical protein